MEAPAVHALERDEVSAGIGNRDRDRDPGLPGLGYGGVGYFLCARAGEALGGGGEHLTPVLARALCPTQAFFSAPPPLLRPSLPPSSNASPPLPLCPGCCAS